MITTLLTDVHRCSIAIYSLIRSLATCVKAKLSKPVEIQLNMDEVPQTLQRRKARGVIAHLVRSATNSRNYNGRIRQDLQNCHAMSTTTGLIRIPNVNATAFSEELCICYQYFPKASGVFLGDE